MPLKQRYKTRILWTTISAIGALVVAYIVVPPAINIDGMRPNIEKSVYDQTGEAIKINGHVKFSLLGTATISATNVSTQFGNIDNITLSVPVWDIFNIKNAKLNNDIDIHGANFVINNVYPAILNHDINIYNSNIVFLGKEYTIIRGNMSHGNFNGTIRTNQHKYDINLTDGNFIVKNNNNNLIINGMLYPDGSARGNLSIETDNINRWFEFGEPLIDTHVSINMNFDWDGEYGFEFTDITANNVHGRISLSPDGYRTINLSSNNLNYDLSFLLAPNSLFYRTHFNLDFYGDLLLGTRHFKHLIVDVAGDKSQVNINNIVADNISMTGGTIDKNGGHDINLTISNQHGTTACLFSGTPSNWECSKFTYHDITGTLSVQDNTFKATITSSDKMPPMDTIVRATKPLGSKGSVDFTFADQAGLLAINQDQFIPTFTFSSNTTLQELNFSFPFLPEFMKSAPGNLTTENDTITFIPHDKTWTLSISKNTFNITGNDLRLWILPEQKLSFINEIPYIISGKYGNGYISDLKFLLAGQVLNGTSNKDTITLESPELNLDAFINPEFFENFESNSFLVQHPLIELFDIPFNISVHADRFIYDGTEYNNFVYSLKKDTQVISISDNDRGNILAEIKQNQKNYDITLQLNKFVLDGALLTYDMPLNVYNTSITGDASLHTYGYIANDILYNMNGTFDLTMDGGDFIGFGVDDFYAQAPNIGTLNGEYILSRALDSGISTLKKMRIIGKYENGIFTTAFPASISLRHTDIIGALTISDSDIDATFEITLRGTSPQPTPISLHIGPNNSRQYSLSDIMTNFDPEYMRAFIQTHNQF